MKAFSSKNYLDTLFQQLMDSPPVKIKLTKEWITEFPAKPGVYIFRNKKKIIYAGETGNLRARMRDVCNTKNHCLRRNIGNLLYCELKGWEKATSRKSFTDTIELLLNEHFKKNLSVAVFPVPLGRKELEERLFKECQPEYNKRGARKCV